MRSIKWWHFQWPSRTLIPVFKVRGFAHFIVFWVTILYLCKYHVYNSMQRMWKQSPKQSIYDIRLHTKKPRYQNLHGPIGGGRPLRLPLDPPLNWQRNGRLILCNLLWKLSSFRQLSFHARARCTGIKSEHAIVSDIRQPKLISARFSHQSVRMIGFGWLLTMTCTGVLVLPTAIATNALIVYISL